MNIAESTRWVALVAAASLAGCHGCGDKSGAGSSSSPEASASASAGAEDAGAEDAGTATTDTDLPEVRDTGPGRATAALRAVLQANGVAFDAAKLLADCKVDDDGASIDDLEDVAGRYGLDALQIILPPEHVLLPEARVVPGIVTVDGPDESRDFVVVWRLDGDRALVMSPAEGRRWVPRKELQQTIYVHEMTIPAEDWRAAVVSDPFRDALRARMAALGLGREAGEAAIGRAHKVDPEERGLGALDAAIRQMEGDPAKAAGDPGAFMGKALGCALDGACDGVEKIPPELWSAQAAAAKGPNGEAQVTVRGAVMLAIPGKKAADAP